MFSVNKILIFAFCYLVISGVRCYSCLWLELVPPVVLLASVSTLGIPTLSRVSVFRVLSAGKLSSCREDAQRSGAQICLLDEDEDLKRGLSQKLCCFCSPCAFLCRLVSEGLGTQYGSLTCSGGQSPPRWPPLLWRGKVPGCLEVRSASWLKVMAQNGACPRSCVASAFRRLSCADSPHFLYPFLC